MSVAASSDWDLKFSLDDYTIRELEFWESNLKQLNSRELDEARNQTHYVVY
jgi:hypothetical protein